MELVFLGTGGGRVVTILQARRTGGFLIKTREHQIHVDPGPGAIVSIRKFNENAQKTDILCLSHNHTDHVDDARVISEAIRRDGILITGKSCIEPPGGIISPYYKKMFGQVFCLEPNEEISLDKLKVKAIRMLHAENALGFVFESGHRLGYISDTGYFPSLGKKFDKLDALVVNVLRPNSDTWKGHLCSEQVIQLLDSMQKKPKIVFLTHFGMKMLRANPVQEARDISKKAGVLCRAANDGMRFNLESEFAQTRLF